MNTDVMFSSKTNLWETPQGFFDEVNQEFGFSLDACALPENAKVQRFYSPEQDGLIQPWTGTVWCNPPYGREIGKWVKKAYDTAAGGGHCCHASSCSNRYQLVPSVHLQKCRGQVYTRPLEIWAQ